MTLDARSAVEARPEDVPTSPYKGLAAFEDSDLDAIFFFGREREVEIIEANLTAYRLTVLYGATGVGKTSVLRAGVAHELRRRGAADADAGRAPEVAVVVFGSWTGDVVGSLATAVRDELVELFGEEAVSAAAGKSLADTLGSWIESLGCDLFLILDQAEEYFLYHARDSAAAFADEFGDLVTRPGLRANVLIALREDALAKLDRFKSRIPGLFANYLRLDHLDRRAARSAIEEPLREYNRLVPGQRVEIESALVEAVLNETVAGRVELTPGTRGDSERAAANGRIEAPYLQLVMQRLWEEERSAGSSVLRLQTLEQLGGAAQIVKNHLESALESLSGDERDLAAAVFNFLVTPSGTKVAHGVADLAGYADVPEDELRPVIGRLVGERIVRPVSANGNTDGATYEIFHDVLAEPIVAWRASHVANRTLWRERLEARRRHRRLLAVTVAALIALAAMTVVTIFALKQRSEARAQRAAAGVQARLAQLQFRRARNEATTANAQKFVVKALSLLSSRPDRSLALAVQAAGLRPRAAEEALRQSLAASRTRIVLPGGGGAVRQALISPDGRFAVTAAGGGEARLFDASTGALLYTLRHDGPVKDVAFSPDGRLVATASADRTAALWQTATGKRQYRFRLGGPVNDVAFSNDGQSLAAASSDKTVRVWSVASGQQLRSIDLPVPARGVAFSPNGRRIVVVGDDRDARVFSVVDGSLVFTLPHDARVTSASYSQRRRLIVTSSMDHLARVWDAGRGAPRHELSGHTLGVLSAAFNAGGSLVVTAGADGVARVYDISDIRGPEKVLATLVGHTSYVADASFSRDGNWVVTASADKSARVWTTSGRALPPLLGHTDTVNTASFGPSSSEVITASGDGTARVWDSGAQYELRPLYAQPARCALEKRCKTTESLSPDDRMLVSAGAGSSALVWQFGRGVVAKLQQRAKVTSAEFSPNGRLVATGSLDHTAALWRVPGGRRSQTLPHGGAVRALAFSRDSRFVITGSDDHTAAIWDTRSGHRRLRIRFHKRVTAVAYSPRSDRALAGAADGSVALIEVPTGRVRRLQAQRGAIVSLAFSPNGRTFVTASGARRDPTAKLWNAATGGFEHKLREHVGGLTSAAFSPDSSLLVTASQDATARVWDVATGVQRYKLGGHFGRVNDAEFSPDGRWIVTAGPSAAGLWRVSTGNFFEFLRTRAVPLTAASFEPDSRHVVAAGADGSIRRYECELCAKLPGLLRLAHARLKRLPAKPNG